MGISETTFCLRRLSKPKMLSSISALAYAPTMAPVSTVTRAAAPQMMDLAGLKDQAKQLNPVVGFFDPLNLSEGEFWGDSNAATIGFLRESEIKHGRIAMFGFVGYIVHANGIHWPTKGPWDNIPTDISPQEMWDLTPEAAKWQIILTIAFLEFWRENAYVLAMIGLLGFLAETQLQGSVPGLTGLGLKAYSGNIMAPFDSNFHIFGQ